jgi:ribosomal-protein-alanine N-acetyltransferase
MEIIGLKGERVRLVPPEPALHLENGVRWMNDPEVTASLAENLGVTRRLEELFFERIATERENALHWAIVAEELGFIGLNEIHWRVRATVGGIVIGERKAWGQGYAADAIRVRTRFVFEQLGLHRIEGHTINPAMRRVYEKCGYQHEGVARQKIWRDGRWHDAHLYAILDGDYFAIPEAAIDPSAPPL